MVLNAALLLLVWTWSRYLLLQFLLKCCLLSKPLSDLALKWVIRSNVPRLSAKCKCTSFHFSSFLNGFENAFVDTLRDLLNQWHVVCIHRTVYNQQLLKFYIWSSKVRADLKQTQEDVQKERQKLFRWPFVSIQTGLCPTLDLIVWVVLGTLWSWPCFDIALEMLVMPWCEEEVWRSQQTSLGLDLILPWSGCFRSWSWLGLVSLWSWC